MKKIAVLGPKGTYSDIACELYLKQQGEAYEVKYYPSILKTALAVEKDTLAILPFENTLDGFVVESMDQMIAHRFQILSQIKVNIDFAFVTNAKKLEDVEVCYVQFKAYGQCLEFLSLYSFSICTTQSNIESMERVLSGDKKCGAIIPMHSLDSYSFETVIPHIADSKHNETRFFIVSKEKTVKPILTEAEVSLVVTAKKDRPGILYDILKNFHDLNINLKSILSRPMKTEMGQYRFYIECSLLEGQMEQLKELLMKFASQEDFEVLVLGIYNKL